MAELESESSVTLVARARDGDELALEELCARYLPRLRRWAHGRLPSWARGAIDTHDLAQDTLSHVVQRITTFNPQHDAAFQAYLRQSLMNRVRDAIRSAQRRPAGDPLDSAQPSESPSPLEEAIGRQAMDRYEAALQRLKPADREAIILRIEMGLSNAELAQALGRATPAAAHMAVSRALVKLAEEMANPKSDGD
jgi:RNA polymerase sigma-70 factor (ECF subfamily)